MTGLRNLYENNFLDFASYVIKERAIPDAADGLKPVQRRILWSLLEMDDGRFNKVANVIGHAMRYHPHGDQSIGAALVALANRSYFIERQGNFGNILTGDEASAPRYIECRLTPLARDVLFNNDVTSFEQSYDGRNREPLLFPAKIPVLLLLGAEGIAVGMSTKILPHNFNEVLRAQISALRNQEFTLYPDFQQGGAMDVSAYEDGSGRIKCRARIERRENKKVVITQIPFGTTTESIISSIENAARKGRLKISSIDDFTTDSAEIEITVARGVSADETIQRLYASTDCEVVHTSNMMVIMDGTPVEVTVSDLVRYSAESLKKILRAELQLELKGLGDRLHWMTLEQIFVENRLYKLIEECPTLEEVREAVFSGLEPFLKDYDKEVTREDVDRLLALKIRRISKFDIEAHRREIGEIKSAMRLARKRLKHLTDYAVEVLEGFIENYGKDHHRLTSIEEFSDIDKREVAIANLKLGWEQETGFIGTSVKGDKSWNVSELDRILYFLEDGTYRVIPMQEKYMITGRVLWCGPCDREKVYACVYRNRKTKIAYVKRFPTGGYILDREYRFVPEASEIMVFMEDCNAVLDYWFQRVKRMKTRKGETSLHDISVKGVKAKGVQLCGKKIISTLKVVQHQELPEEEEPAEEENTPEESASSEAKESRSIEEITAEAEVLRNRMSSILKKFEGDTPDLFGEE
ncbi:DNA topoisomerase IV [Candidatus Fermentibacteria bacterium]|nr:MAG: DNA topoisomerase IV [Candidatus Fermentibacteria bacterium]PIE53368.1 MAG: DNA topoisomerase IV [Candidatus Fermentibacteria bacterium]